MNNNKTKNIILAVLVIGLVGMTIAYASLTQTLTINNNQATVSSNWRVRFAPTVTTSVGTTVAGTTTGASYTQNTPVLDNDRQTIKNLQATFTKPGDYVEVAFTVRNEGNIAAKGSSTTLNLGNLSCANGSGSSIDQSDLNTFCSKLTKWVKHSDRTTDFSSADTLAPYSGSGDNYPHIDGILRIEYPSTLSNADIAAINGGSVVVTLGDTTLHFEQNDSYTPPIPPELETTAGAWHPTYFAYGTPTTSSTTDVTTLNKNVFVGLDTSGNKGVCMIRNNTLYCFKANNVEYEQTHLQQVFSDISCSVFSNYFRCKASDFYCSVRSDGYVDCLDYGTNEGCMVDSVGAVGCN